GGRSPAARGPTPESWPFTESIWRSGRPPLQRSAKWRAPSRLLSQHRFEDLPSGIPGQRLRAHRDELRHLEVGEVLPRMTDDRADVQLLAGDRDDHRAHLLAHDLVGHGDHGHLEDTRGRGQDVLDLDAVDLLPAAVDHVLGAVDDVHEALAVDAGKVAAVEPAVDERLRGGLGLVPVARDHVGAADEQLADPGFRVLVEQVEVAYRRR